MPPPPLLPLLPLSLLLLLLPTLSHAHALSAVQRSATCPVILPQDAPSAPDPRSQPTPRIINGDLASPSLRTSLAALRIISSNGVSACTAVLLSPLWLLTAAHCEPSRTTTVAIAVDRRPSNAAGYTHRVQRAFIHPGFADGTLRNDIALVRLADPAPPGATFMRLSVNRDDPRPFTFARPIGYGTAHPAGARPPGTQDFLSQVDVPVTPNDFCTGVYPFVSLASQLCAGYRRGRCDSCFGDSGGPLVQYDTADNPVVVGIVSFGGGRRCAQPDTPGVYTRTSFFREWIESTRAEYTPADDIRPINGPADFDSSPLSTLTIALIAISAGTIGVVLFCVCCIRVRNRRLRKDEQAAGATLGAESPGLAQQQEGPLEAQHAEPQAYPVAYPSGTYPTSVYPSNAGYVPQPPPSPPPGERWSGAGGWQGAGYYTAAHAHAHAVPPSVLQYRVVDGQVWRTNAGFGGAQAAAAAAPTQAGGPVVGGGDASAGLYPNVSAT